MSNRSLRWSRWFVLLMYASSLARFSFAAEPLPPTHVDDFTGRPRLVIMSDIGNEPDDQMSFVRLLLYSNEFEIEGIVATTSTWQKSALHPETMHALIEAYGKVRSNLLLHAKGWPTAEELNGRVLTGQPGYGLAAIGTDKMSAGAEAIIRAVDRNDPRPLWISIWGGANTLAQALLHVRHSTSRRGGQIRREDPGLFHH